MKKKSITNENCALATDFRKLDQEMIDWLDQREKKGNIYRAFSEYILCLESSLEHEEDFFKRCLIENEIKELKKEQKKYYVPSMLEMARPDLLIDREVSKDALEKSSFTLVKKIIKK